MEPREILAGEEQAEEEEQRGTEEVGGQGCRALEDCSGCRHHDSPSWANATLMAPVSRSELAVRCPCALSLPHGRGRSCCDLD